MNNNLDGFNGLYGPGPYAVLNEMGHSTPKTDKARRAEQVEAQAWLWKHKVQFIVSGLLLVAALLVTGGNGI